MTESKPNITYRGHLWAQCRTNIGDEWKPACEIVAPDCLDKSDASEVALTLLEGITLAAEKTYLIDICLEKIERRETSRSGILGGRLTTIIDTLVSEKIIKPQGVCPECKAKL